MSRSSRASSCGYSRNFYRVTITINLPENLTARSPLVSCYGSFFNMNDFDIPRSSTNRKNSSPDLPIELWEEVFYWATFSDIRRNISSALIHIEPYASGYGLQPYDHARKVLSVKCSLSLVCSSWRALSLPFLLEDIWIHARGVRALETVLERESDRDGKRLGSLVRCARVQLYRAGTGEYSYYKTVVSPRTGRILSLCRDIRLLVTLRGVFPVEKHKTGNTYYPADVAFRDLYMPKLVFAELIGCMAVPDFVVRAPHLQYLSIQDDVTWGTAGLRGKIRILDIIGRALAYSMNISQQNLDRLILRPSFGNLLVLSEPIAHFASVRHLEIRFGTHIPISDLIQYVAISPGLESLCYPVMIVSTFPDDQHPPYTQSSLKIVELHDACMTSSPKDTEFAVRHIKWLCYPGSPFSGLKEIVLHGSTWRELIEKPHFDEIEECLVWKGVSITFDQHSP